MQTIEEKFSEYTLESLPPLKEDLFLASHVTDELRPCPFCGEIHILTSGFQNSVSHIIGYRVFCTDYRDCTANITAQGETREEARRKAVARWNQRVSEAK